MDIGHFVHLNQVTWSKIAFTFFILMKWPIYLFPMKTIKIERRGWNAATSAVQNLHINLNIGTILNIMSVVGGISSVFLFCLKWFQTQFQSTNSHYSMLQSTEDFGKNFYSEKYCSIFPSNKCRWTTQKRKNDWNTIHWLCPFDSDHEFWLWNRLPCTKAGADMTSMIKRKINRVRRSTFSLEIRESWSEKASYLSFDNLISRKFIDFSEIMVQTGNVYRMICFQNAVKMYIRCRDYVNQP